MKIHCLTHVPFEDAANIGRWAKDRRHSLTYTHFFRDGVLPDSESFDKIPRTTEWLYTILDAFTVI